MKSSLKRKQGLTSSDIEKDEAIENTSLIIASLDRALSNLPELALLLRDLRIENVILPSLNLMFTVCITHNWSCFLSNSSFK